MFLRLSFLSVCLMFVMNAVSPVLALDFDTDQVNQSRDLYQQLYYNEPLAILIGGSQRKLAKDPSKGGGPLAHSAAYIHGARIDSSRGYPRIVAISKKDLEDPKIPFLKKGVGVSVNPLTSNVQMVAIPGEYFFNGGFDSRKALTEADMDQLIKDMTPYYEGILPRKEWVQETDLEAIKLAISKNGCTVYKPTLSTT